MVKLNSLPMMTQTNYTEVNESQLLKSHPGTELINVEGEEIQLEQVMPT